MPVRTLLLPLLLILTANSAPLTDEESIRALEQVWHGSGAAEQVERFLADDFERPMPSGEIWDKERQLEWLRSHSAPAALTGATEHLNIRFYGDSAVTTGIATIVDQEGRELDRTIFTNVYTKRGGNWQLVSAHRSAVARPQGR